MNERERACHSAQLGFALIPSLLRWAHDLVPEELDESVRARVSRLGRAQDREQLRLVEDLEVFLFFASAFESLRDLSQFNEPAGPTALAASTVHGPAGAPTLTTPGPHALETSIATTDGSRTHHLPVWRSTSHRCPPTHHHPHPHHRQPTPPAQTIARRGHQH